MGAAKSQLEASAGAPPPSWEAQRTAPEPVGRAPEEEILAQVSHDLGSHFHRLYYCADRLRSSRAEDEGTATSELLERSVRSLDKLLKTLMAYLLPVRLERMRMSGADLASAVSSVLRSATGEGDTDVACGPGVHTAVVEIDPGRFAAALRSIAWQLLPGDTDGAGRGVMHARLRRVATLGPEYLEMTLERATDRAGGEQRGHREALEWAAAERVLTAHGGHLARRAEGNGSLGCTITLPLADGEA